MSFSFRNDSTRTTILMAAARPASRGRSEPVFLLPQFRDPDTFERPAVGIDRRHFLRTEPTFQLGRADHGIFGVSPALAGNAGVLHVKAPPACGRSGRNRA